MGLTLMDTLKNQIFLNQIISWFLFSKPKEDKNQKSEQPETVVNKDSEVIA